MGSHFREFSDDTLNGFGSFDQTTSPGYDESLNYAYLLNFNDPSQELTSLDLPTPLPNPIPYNFTSSSNTSSGDDDVLKCISQMLMEEDMEDKPCMLLDALALQAAEKPFYDALGKKYSPFSNHSLGSLDDSSFGSTSEVSLGTSLWEGKPVTSVPPHTLREQNKLWEELFSGVSDQDDKSSIAKTPQIESFSQPSALPQWSFGSLGMGIFSERESMIQFQKGVEEASKFLPKNNNFVIDLENITFPNEISEEALEMVLKNEKVDETSLDHISRGRKIHYREEDEEEDEQGRSRKQAAIFFNEDADELSDMFDRVLLHPNSTCDVSHTTMGSSSKKGSPKKRDKSKDVVDLRTLLIRTSESIASDDRRTTDKLLKQIREHSSPEGDGSQRLAHYFANALEARLSGSGSQIYTALSSKIPTAAKMIKAYEFSMLACPGKKIFIAYANHLIVEASEKASKLHVVDFGILYGFQWPNLIQRLAERPGGPPRLCITGIDLPQPGFRPGERVEATGHRLAKYCDRFKVPFEYHAIAKKWETIKPKDLKIGGRSDNDDEIVAVNCLFRFKNLLDETVVIDSPRNAVLNLIRRVIKPDIFVHAVVNGSYNAPFFVSRFKETLFHYSTLFDTLEANSSRGDPERLMLEKEFYGREIMNVVACEGTERVERPETYKQWQLRNTRAGFRQVPLDPKIIEKLKSKVKVNYHRDFVVDVDGHWTLWGWKGRITYAMSTWVPA